MKWIFSLNIILICLTSYCNPIDENMAKRVGTSFLSQTKAKFLLNSSSDIKLVYKLSSKGIDNISYSNKIFFYVFNVDISGGFVIVSGDDFVTPILGYSNEGSFNPNNIPPNVAKWFEGYKREIEFVVENKINASSKIKLEWKNLIEGKAELNKVAGVLGVSQLVQTKWNQYPYYNALCPYDYQYGERTVTGCVATAMAQIMKYWNYPTTGSGFHSYSHSRYGTLSANFGSTNYQWGSMPNQVNSSNTAVATLMYHCGVSVEMNYNINSEGGSSSYTSDVPEALINYFGYTSSAAIKYRSNYSESQWIQLLKNELDAGRPMQYSGRNSGGHSFVCDGYDNSNYFHFNWGWGGSFDGYFSVNSLNPSNYTFNLSQAVVIGIKPPEIITSYNLRLYDYVTASPSTIYYGEAFTVNTNILNSGNKAFAGDYCAAIFDANNNFIDYIETKYDYTLPAGHVYTNNLIFSSAGNYQLTPGNYKIGVYYRPTGENWSFLSDYGSYENWISFSVINPNDIELFSPITVTPGTTVTQGQSISVNLNIKNFGYSTFTGYYQVNLYNLDGTYAETINTIYENNGLQYLYYYISPYLTFYKSSISSEPGNYLLAVVHKSNTGNLEWTGSSIYQNPIMITVKAPDIIPDKYEVNNSIAQAYTLPVVFSGSNASLNTFGSNCHIGTDIDYYKINLPAGYNYIVNARLHDSYNSENGNSYTLDALFSYSKDGGVNWTDTYDDILPNSILISGGNSIYFDVAPYFLGRTGSYLLDIQITRQPYQFLWVGGVSTDWNDKNNWSTVKVPTSIDDVIINAGTLFSPVISSGVIGVCKSIRANNGAIVTIATGGKLNVFK